MASTFGSLEIAKSGMMAYNAALHDNKRKNRPITHRPPSAQL